ncbi:NAD(P) transhydrogenase subunit alpha [bacterium]|nr:NAD(P) transhydrogenase subunit alpha [bacterium]
MELVLALTVFVLATLLGFEIITKVPPLLHTPLMSGSNAISGITIIGSLVAAGSGFRGLAAILGMCAVIFAMINVVGGYLVTHRMLKSFKKSK